MQTNQTFNLPRFRQHARAHFSEKKRAYVWYFAILGMIYFMLLLMFVIGDSGKFSYDAHRFLYYMGLLTTGSVFALRYFSSLSRTGSALVCLMQPVAHFEKWLLALLMTLVLYPIAYTLLFNVMTMPASWLMFFNSHPNADLHLTEILSFYYLPLIDHSSSKESGNLIIIAEIPLWLIYYGLCAYALTASVFFKRLPMIKSVALGFGIFLFILLFVVAVAHSNNFEVLFSYWVKPHRGTYDASFARLFINVLAWFCVPTLMLIASYFALKERDLT